MIVTYPVKLQFSHLTYHIYDKWDFWRIIKQYDNGPLMRDVTWEEAAELCTHQNSTLLTLADLEEEHVLSLLFNIHGKSRLQTEVYLYPVIYLGLKSVQQVFLFYPSTK